MTMNGGSAVARPGERPRPGWRRRAGLALACACLLLAGCGGLRPKSGNTQAEIEAWARGAGYQASTLASSPFRLFSLLRVRRPSPLLVIYVEGDGSGRPSPYRAFEPTPRIPHALHMAQHDPSPAVAYLARPCQYLRDADLPACDSQHWVPQRFSADVLDSMAAAVDELKRRSGAERVSFVGYGGGGVIAVMLAGGRDDVAEVITVASPLSLAGWVARNRLGWINPALDPIEQAPLAPSVAVTHFVGGRDDVVAPEFSASYVGRVGGKLIYLADFGHDCCWDREWPWLLEQARGEKSAP